MRPNPFLALSLWLLAGAASAATGYTQPHLSQAAGDESVTFQGQAFIDHGLVGTGRLSAQTVDFMGDTLGSFSSLGIQPGSWRRVGDHYEAVLWTLPDRGLNDPGAHLFYDYAARLHRFRLRFTPDQGTGRASAQQVEIVPDGGLVLTDFRGKPFTGVDPAQGTLTEHGILLPSPSHDLGAGKVSIDAESLQFTRDGSFYVGDEYAANVYYFDAKGRLRGVITPPPAVVPRTGGKIDFNSLAPPETGRRNNQGVEGMSLSPDGTRLFVALQSALIQDSAKGNASGRVNTRVLVYDVSHQATPAHPIGHYVITLPAYTAKGDGGALDQTAAQSEVRALNDHQFLMLSRDGNGLGSDNGRPFVTKSVLLVDTNGATNLAGSRYETTTASVLAAPVASALRDDIQPLAWVELVNLLNPVQLGRFGLNLDDPMRREPTTLSEKWEAMDLVPTLDPAHPEDWFLFVGNDNDFIASHCVMQGQACDATFDNDNRLLVYRLTLPTMQRPSAPAH
ncbi:esterase-like activity of phytase family protein [Dyella sedimenti]|uniref:esterase-like activity of phytase family protein n=1 Tax=Dyella sedimenti TaxID=2919947 RepID=UPI001FA9CE23|nr:esterase-like activity of phytase family protein [Dyella sedimenti]